MKVEKAFELIKDDLKNVEKALIDTISTDVELINKVLTYLLASGGKRLRPAFLTLSSKLCGYEGDKHILLSCIIEYLHTATLLHDDIIDGAKYRRNRPSANHVFGNDVSILCGDFLYSRSYILLAEHAVKRAQVVLAGAALTMSEGEVIQLLKIGNTDITFEDYIKIIKCKTAVLFSAACEMGAVTAGAEEAKCKALADFGTYLGIAFQMSDDILDYMGDPEITGKKLGTDLHESKLTLPIILLLQHCTSDEKTQITEIFAKKDKSDEDLNYIIKLLNDNNIKDKCEELVDEYVTKSLSQLNIFEDCDYKDAIISIANALMKREK